ncbi:MAG TPA: VOC family protein, partial [Aestuariivirga sp.]|nr:VOC family protein [Aestuariivirga sp.]
MRVDHLVWYCADLAEGERFFAERMDRASAYGGVHPGEGTANRLLSLSDATYLEILGRDPAQPETNLAPEVRSL